MPCDCECHTWECRKYHGFNGAFSAYCDSCERIYIAQAECGCCDEEDTDG